MIRLTLSSYLKHLNSSLLTALILSSSFTALAATPNKDEKTINGSSAQFQDWEEVQSFIEQMRLKYDFKPEELRALFKKIKFVESSIQLIKPAPVSKPKNWKAYRARFVDNVRINQGIQFWDTNQKALDKAEKEFGVPPHIITALIGVETLYGKQMGNYRIIDAITTLAFAYPDTPNKEARSAYFKNELEQLFLFARDTKTDIWNIKGSYAGATGLGQFMPSSLRKYAIDFDGDGKIDLKNSAADAIGSVAHYLAKHGWDKNLTYAYPIEINTLATNEEKLNELINRGLKATWTLEQLNPYIRISPNNTSNGPLIVSGMPTPSTLMYGVIDLQNGNDATEYWIATNNFFALTHYNRSYFYAMSIIELANVIAMSKASIQ